MKRSLALLLACAAVAGSCSKAPPPEQDPAAQVAYARADAPAAPRAEGYRGPVRVGGNLASATPGEEIPSQAAGGQTAPPLGQLPVPQDRKLIRDANVRLEVKGPRMQVWVDGRRALDVTDNAFKSGFAGLAGYGDRLLQFL